MEYFVMRFPGTCERAVTLSYDDGVEQDIQLVEILNKYEMKGTFNINTGTIAPEDKPFGKGGIHRRLTASLLKSLFADGRHEVAVHTLTHPHLEKHPMSSVTYEIMQDRKNIEDMFGTVARGMAYPYGTYNDEVVEAARACGICYSRTVKSNKDFSIPTDWLRMGATCHHTSPDLPALTDKFLAERKEGAEPWLFYLWGHSYEFERADNWDVIETFCEKVHGRRDTWYATNIEIYDYVTAFRSLVPSVDGKRVYNPSAIEVFFWRNKKNYSVKPGATLVIE